MTRTEDAVVITFYLDGKPFAMTIIGDAKTCNSSIEQYIDFAFFGLSLNNLPIGEKMKRLHERREETYAKYGNNEN